MVNKALVAGIIGFILGGLLVSIAATTFDKKDSALQRPPTSNRQHTTMNSMQRSN